MMSQRPRSLTKISLSPTYGVARRHARRYTSSVWRNRSSVPISQGGRDLSSSGFTLMSCRIESGTQRRSVVGQTK